MIPFNQLVVKYRLYLVVSCFLLLFCHRTNVDSHLLLYPNSNMKNMCIDKQTDRQTDRQTNKQTDKQKNRHRKIDRMTDTDTDRHGHSQTQSQTDKYYCACSLRHVDQSRWTSRGTTREATFRCT